MAVALQCKLHQCPSLEAQNKQPNEPQSPAQNVAACLQVLTSAAVIHWKRLWRAEYARKLHGLICTLQCACYTLSALYRAPARTQQSQHPKP